MALRCKFELERVDVYASGQQQREGAKSPGRRPSILKVKRAGGNVIDVAAAKRLVTFAPFVTSVTYVPYAPLASKPSVPLKPPSVPLKPPSVPLKPPSVPLAPPSVERRRVKCKHGQLQVVLENPRYHAYAPPSTAIASPSSATHAMATR